MKRKVFILSLLFTFLLCFTSWADVCDEQGHTWDAGICSVCGVEHVDHEWSEGICSVCGLECTHVWEDGTCTVCGLTCERHTWSEGFCTTCGTPHTNHVLAKKYDTANHWDECGVCGYKENEEAHNLVDTVTIEATCTGDGQLWHSCSACDYAYAETIPQLDHDYQWKWYDADGYSNAYKQLTCTMCGGVTGERVYSESSVKYVTRDYDTGEVLETVERLVTYGTIVRGDTLGTANVTYNGVEYRFLSADGADNMTYAHPGLVLYRNMRKYKYVINFDPDGGSGGPMENITATYGSRVTLPENVYTKYGYDFMGWSKTRGGEVDFADKYWGVDLRSYTESGEKLTLYAVWAGKEVIVSFDCGAGTAPNPVRLRYGQAYGKLPTPTMFTGYRFVSWEYQEIDPSTGNVLSTIPVTSTTIITNEEDHELHCVYRESAISITFITPSKSQTIGGISGYTVSPPFEPVEAGMDFKHWSLSEGGPAFNFDTPIDDDTTFYAVFDGKTVSAELRTYGTIQYTYPAKIGKLPDGSQPGKRFDGWYWDEALTQPVSSTESIPVDDFMLYPKYSTGAYRLTLNVGTSSWDMKYGSTIPTLPVPTRGTAVFLYWEYEGEEVKAGDMYKWSKDVQLIARWQDLYYAVKFPDGTTRGVKDGDAIGTLPTPPTKAGQSFLYYVDQDGIPIYASTKPDRDLQLSYKYSYDSIALKLIDGTNIQTVTRVAGSLLDDLPEHSKPGYTFKGWSQVEGGTPTIGPLYVSTNLYAVYTADMQDVYLQDLDMTIQRQTDAAVGALPEAVRAGKVFLYWTYNGVRVGAETKVPAGGMILVPVYEDENTDLTDTVVVEFWCDGVKINTIDVVRGHVLHDPGEPALATVESGRKFMYWSDHDGGTEYEFEKRVYGDLKLYAQWN